MEKEVIEAAIRAMRKSVLTSEAERVYWYDAYKTRTNPQDRLNAVTMELKAINAKDNALRAIADLTKKLEAMK